MTVMVVLGSPESPKQLEPIAKLQGYQAGDISCTWFEGTEKRTSLFHAATLVKLEDNSGAS